MTALAENLIGEKKVLLTKSRNFGEILISEYFFKANITTPGPEKQISGYTRQLRSGEYLVMTTRSNGYRYSRVSKIFPHEN